MGHGRRSAFAPFRLTIISVNGCFILGLDGHTPDMFQQVLDFAEGRATLRCADHGADAIPGTPLYERLLREGRIIEPGRWDCARYSDVNFIPRGMTSSNYARGCMLGGAVVQRGGAGAPPPRVSSMQREATAPHAARNRVYAAGPFR